MEHITWSEGFSQINRKKIRNFLNQAIGPDSKWSLWTTPPLTPLGHHRTPISDVGSEKIGLTRFTLLEEHCFIQKLTKGNCSMCVCVYVGVGCLCGVRVSFLRCYKQLSSVSFHIEFALEDRCLSLPSQSTT